MALVLIAIIGLMWLWFKNAFGIHFFQDDYWFLKISRIKTFSDFLHFYSPWRTYSYKPLASETFYMVLHWLNYNVFWGHVIMFVSFSIGIVFLYKIIMMLTGRQSVALLSTGLYAMSFTHVFQLYWFATYQEVAMFMFLTVSLYCLLKQRYIIGFLAFIAALLCKETAALYPCILFLIYWIDPKKRILWKPVVAGFLLSGIFYLIYRHSLNQVTSLDNYRMVFNPKLILNNMAWYLLWGLGLPSIMPLYMPKLIGKPIPEFWNLFGFPEFKIYFIFMAIYLILFTLSMLVVLASETHNRKKIFIRGMICLFGFFATLGPILFFPHRWMVRLTLPVIFTSIFQAYMLYLLFIKSTLGKIVVVGIIGCYLVFNYYGTLFHESSSLYLSENTIYLKTASYFNTHRQEISAHPVIFFKDNNVNKTITSINSERLKNSFNDQSFIDHFLPHSNIRALYNFETNAIPVNAYIINTNDILN